MAIKKIFRTGNSHAITIPHKVVRNLGLKSGDKVEVRFSLDQLELVCRFVEAPQLTISQSPINKPK